MRRAKARKELSWVVRVMGDVLVSKSRGPEGSSLQARTGFAELLPSGGSSRLEVA